MYPPQLLILETPIPLTVAIGLSLLCGLGCFLIKDKKHSKLGLGSPNPKT